MQDNVPEKCVVTTEMLHTCGFSIQAGAKTRERAAMWEFVTSRNLK